MREFLGKGGKREISGTKDNAHFQRDGRKLALGHEVLQLFFEAESADPDSSPAGGHCGDVCEKLEKDLLALNSCFFSDILVVHGESPR